LNEKVVENRLDYWIIVRGLLALLCAVQGVATVAIDLSRTHATNPEWPKHARFHVVWQSINTVLLSALVIGLVCWPGPYGVQRFYLAVVATSISLVAFLCALAFRKFYGGGLSDPNGIPPMRVTIHHKTLQVDLNLLAIVAGLLVLAFILLVWFGHHK
jgi:hypothetical protein